MKRNIPSILNSFSFTFDQDFLQAFFKDQFKSLCFNASIDLMTFRNCFDVPYIISDKLFNAINNANSSEELIEKDFCDGMTTLYSPEHNERLKLIFSVIDYDKDGLIRKYDVKSFILHFHLISNKGDIKPLFETVNNMFGEKESMCFEEVIDTKKNDSSDVIVLLLAYFHVYAPFKGIAIEFFEAISGKGKDEPAIKRKSLNNSNATFTINEVNAQPLSNQKSLKSLEESDLNPSYAVLEYLRSNFNEVFPKLGNFISEETYASDEDLAELNAFEEDLNSLKLSYSCIQPNHLRNSFIKPIKEKAATSSSFSHLKVDKSNRKSSFISEGSSHKPTLLRLDKLIPNQIPDNDNLPLSLLFHITSKGDSSFLDECLYQDHHGSKQKADIALIGNMIYIFVKKDTFKGGRAEYELKRAQLLKKLFIKQLDDDDDEEERKPKKEQTIYSCITTIKGFIETFSISFESRSKAEKFIKVFNAVTNHRDIQTEYLMEKQIGLGANGIVKRIKHKKTKEHFALKILPIHYDDKSDMKFSNEELDMCKLLSRVSHENIVKVYDYFETVDFIYIIMEFIQGITLGSYMKAQLSVIRERKEAIVDQLISGLSFLQLYGIIHRDIKPDNVMIADKGNKLQLKLIDFGFSKVILKGEMIKQHLGTVLYASPEMFLQKTYNNTIDLWSLGILLYQFVYGAHPFTHEGDDNEGIVANIIEEELDIQLNGGFSQLDRKLLTIIQMCLERDSSKRETIEEVLTIWKK